ncbi:MULTISPECIES: hypothetical protein [unclassified Kitasatospora]
MPAEPEEVEPWPARGRAVAWEETGHLTAVDLTATHPAAPNRLDAALAREVVSLGFSSPWGPARAGELTADLSRLRDFFAAAAAAGDAVVEFESA